jgi:hypothetical protein
MRENIVPKKEAFLLVESGFSELCMYLYNLKNDELLRHQTPMHVVTFQGDPTFKKPKEIERDSAGEAFAAPLYLQAFKFLMPLGLKKWEVSPDAYNHKFHYMWMIELDPNIQGATRYAGASVERADALANCLRYAMNALLKNRKLNDDQLLQLFTIGLSM